jgi:predicted phage terminase large subunit-like protein
MPQALSGYSDYSTEEKHELGDLVQNISMGKIDLNAIRHSDLSKLQALLTPKTTKYIPHVPTPKQSAFLLLDNKEAFYGGAAGGGKSDALLMAGLQYVDVKGYSGIIFRKTYADLVKPGALIDRAKEWLLKYPEVRWNDKEKKFEFYKDRTKKELISVLQFGYLENANDKYNYQGGEYQFIGFDELTHIDLSSYTYMFSRLRRLKGVKVPLRVRGASNPPDDDGGIWVKTRFIDEGPSHGRVFIPAGMDDNPYLDAEQYEESLQELDPVTRARLRDGNWEIIRKGNMFKRQWFQQVDANSLPIGRRRVRWWDMAASDEEKAKKKNKSKEPDYTVGFLLSECNGIFYIEDIIRDRLRPEGTEALQKNTALGDGYTTMVREEQEPGSSGVAVCDMKKRGIFQGFNYDSIKSDSNKASRASAVSAAAERGQIRYVAGCRNIEAFFNEAESFPGGIHDDIVDGLSGAYNFLCQTSVAGMPTILMKDSEDDNIWANELDLLPGYFNAFSYYSS